MPITTKAGDKGMTSLLFAECAPKDDLRFDACGTLDELSAFLGLAKSLTKDKTIKNIVDRVERDLLLAGAEIVAQKHLIRKLEQRIDGSHVRNLEELISEFERKYKTKGRCFVIAGKNTASASFDVSRTVARRGERLIVALRRKKRLNNRQILVYMNRLSDLLFLVARYCEKV